MKSKLRFTLFAISTLSLLLFLFAKIIDFQFEKAINHPIYNGCNKVWAHAGTIGLQTPNSIESITKVLEKGAAGIELDIFFDIKLNDYVVSHDFPYRLHNGNVLRLQEIIKIFGNDSYYWLDFKNLRDLNDLGLDQAVERMDNLLLQYKLRDRVLVESPGAFNLKKLSDLGIQTSYWVFPRDPSNKLRFWYDIRRYKFSYMYGNFSGLSLDYRRYSDEFAHEFSSIPIYLFTVNNEKLIRKYIQSDNIKIILTDLNLHFIKSSKCAQ